MMNKLIVLLAAVITISFLSCKDNSTGTNPTPVQQGTFKINGYVTLNGEPLEGVQVIVDNALNWRTTTGADGKFAVESLTKGEHKFLAQKLYDNSRSIAQQINIILVNDITDIGEVKLPDPIFLYDVDGSQAGDSKLTLKWSKAAGSDFVEYKLFRKDNDGLDDTNAELVFASSSAADTQFTESNVRSGIKQYYRVYAYSTEQKSSGSNFQSFDMPEINLISNSGFEISENGVFPDSWRESISGQPSFNYFSVSNEFVKEGNKSLKIYYDDLLSNPVPGHIAWGGLMQTIPRNFLVDGREYTLSFWAKSLNGSFQVRLVRNSNLEDAVISYIIPNNTDWTEQRFTFKVDQANYYELWISTRPGFMVNGTVSGYIDDLKMLR